jgi:hypothetical protein
MEGDLLFPLLETVADNLLIKGCSSEISPSKTNGCVFTPSMNYSFIFPNDSLGGGTMLYLPTLSIGDFFRVAFLLI